MSRMSNQTMVKDIVCGKEVSPETAVTTNYGDRPYYFCSKACSMEFAGDPLKFVDKSKSISSTEGSLMISESGELTQKESSHRA